MLKKIWEKIRLLTISRKEPYLLFASVLGFMPRKIHYYELAMIHKSIPLKGRGGFSVHNERLEFLGDAVLNAVVADILYHHFAGKHEGFLTNTRSKIVQRETLNRIAIDLGINKLVKTPSKNHTHNINIYGNAFEALIGAIYLDYGPKKCKEFVEKVILNKYLDINQLAHKEVNFKSRLIEWSQRFKLPLTFELIEETYDKEHNPVFRTQILINGIFAAHGVGYSKKESHQNAAQIALKKVKKKKHLFLKGKTIK